MNLRIKLSLIVKTIFTIFLFQTTVQAQELKKALKTETTTPIQKTIEFNQLKTLKQTKSEQLNASSIKQLNLNPNKKKLNREIDNRSKQSNSSNAKRASDVQKASNDLEINSKGKSGLRQAQQESNSTVTQAFDSSFDAVKGKREDKSKRDASSKHYINEDGSYTALIGAGPIHYLSNGQYLDIDTNITPALSATYPFVNNTNLFESHFGANSNTGIKNKTAEGEVKEFLNTRMYWEVNGQEVGTVHSADVSVSVQGEKAYYNNIYGQISAEFTMKSGKRELNYIIPNQQALGNIPNGADYLVFTEDVVLPFGWTHAITEQGILIKDALGTEMYLYGNPVSTDAANELTREKNTIFETQIIGNTLHIKTKVKTEWLLDSARVYPIMVDPTVTFYPTGNGNYVTGWIDASYVKTSNDDIFVGARYSAGEKKIWRGWSTFNLTTIPENVDISNIGFGFYTGINSLNANQSIYIGPITSGVPNEYTGTTLYDMCSEFEDSPWLTLSKESLGNLYFDLDPWQNNEIKNSIPSGSFSFGFYPDGSFHTNLTHQVAIYGSTRTQSTTNGKPYLSITYTLPGGCSSPSNLNVDNITHNSARFTWNAASPAPASGYDYYYNTTGIAPGTNGNGTVTTTSRNQTGLTSNTVYHFWIRSRCNASSQSDWVYGGHFNTTPEVCFQGDGQVKGPVVDGNGVTMTDVYRVADDFIVPNGETFTLKHVSIEALSQTTVTGVTINVRENDEGQPGAIIATAWNNAAPSASHQYDTAFGFNVYHLTFNNITAVPPLNSGTYWLEVTMRNSNTSTVYWRATDTGTTGVTAQNSGDSGTSWVPSDDGYDMVFYVAGDCVSCDPITVTSSEHSVCEGGTVNLTASSTNSGYTYHWYIGWQDDDQTYDVDLGVGATKTVTVEESTVYWVIATNSTGCRTKSYVIVSVTPPPTLIVMDPIEAIACSDETRKISVVDGGFISETILIETFNDVNNLPWVMEYSHASTNPADPNGDLSARWWIYEDGYADLETFHSNDNSDFAMVDGDWASWYNSQIESSFISPPMNLVDYDSSTTNISLEFYHYFRQFSNASDAYVEITTNDTDWAPLAHYTSTQGQSTSFKKETINLDTYKGEPYVRIRFRYFSTNGWYWAIDNVNITGTNPLPTTITWSPATGLWRDEARTIAYNGTHATTLYASPENTTTYTVSASTAVGCPAEAEVTVERGDKIWQSSGNNDWFTANNWTENSIPTEDHCVIIPNGTVVAKVSDFEPTGFAKNLTIQSGGQLEIEDGGALTVTDFVKNGGTADDFIIREGGNLVQIDDDAVNIGPIKAEKNFTFSPNREQYNFVMPPVVDMPGNNIFDIYPGTYLAQYYNESNNQFIYFNSSQYVEDRPQAISEPQTGGSIVTGNFTGRPFNGKLNKIGLSNAHTGFHLAGNPYPSQLDLNAFYQDNKTNIEARFLFWDNRGNPQIEQHGDGYNGDHYAQYNATNSTGTAAAVGPGTEGYSPKVPTQNVAVGNGFMLRLLFSPAQAAYEMNNSHRTTGQGANFLGKGNNFTSDKDRYWLVMETPGGLNVMNAVVYFQGGNDEYGMDDNKTTGGSDDFYSMVENHKLAIQGKAPFNDKDVVPLGYKAFAPGFYTVSIYDKEGVFESGQKIYIKDKVLGTNRRFHL